MAWMWLLACSMWPDLGDEPLDQVALDDAPALAHVVAVLDAEVETVGDLLAEAQAGPTFTSAPDPGDWLDDQLQEPVDTGVSGTELTVLSYNVGLLDRNYLFTNVAVPEMEARGAVAPELVLSRGYDVVMLQEVWEWEDALAFQAMGEDLGYTAWLGTEKVLEQTGVLILVRDAVLGDAGITEEGQYVAQYGAEESPGPNLKRGWKSWSFELAGSGRTVWLFDTHLVAFMDQWLARTAEARELGLLVDAVPDEDVVIVAGDLNAGSYYPEDVWIDGEGKEHADWWSNTLMLPVLQHYGGLTDAVSAGVGAAELDAYDVLPYGGGESYLDAPYGDASLCGEAFPGWLSASDCNSLHFDNYAGQEFPARLDYVLFRDDTGATALVDVELVFVDPMDIGSQRMELSDHSGVLATFLIED